MPKHPRKHTYIPKAKPYKGVLTCGHCKRRFLTMAAWWLHRYGPYDDRRCLEEYEMRALSMRKDVHGRWLIATPEWIANMKALKKRVHDQHNPKVPPETS